MPCGREKDGLLVVLGSITFAAACGIAYLLFSPLLNWEEVRGWFGM